MTPRLLSEMCETCIFRPGNLMHLRPGRLKEMASPDHHVTCHKTLSYGEHPDFGEAMCRGYYDRIGMRNNYIRIVERLGGFAEVEPPSAVSS